MLLGVGNLGYKLSVCEYFCPLSITSAHTLARSLHDVSRANNNRFVVVVCFRLAFHATKCDFFLKFSSSKFSKNFVPV